MKAESSIDPLVAVRQHQLSGIGQRTQSRKHLGRDTVNILKYKPTSKAQRLCNDTRLPYKLSNSLSTDIATKQSFYVCLLIAVQEHWFLLTQEACSMAKEGCLSDARASTDQ
jgi:hypothetical protein